MIRRTVLVEGIPADMTEEEKDGYLIPVNDDDGSIKHRMGYFGIELHAHIETELL